ncbi:MAG: hypothetical protein AB1743_06345 [Actinomycetota bacterium]
MQALKAHQDSHDKHINDSVGSAIILQKLAQARLHIRLNRCWHNFLFSLLAALSMTLLIEFVFRILIFDNRRIFEALVFTVIPILAVSWPFFQRIDDFKCATTVDLLFKTKERLSTAIELRSQGLRTRFSPEVISDAAKIASTINPAEGFSYRPPKQVVVAIISLVLANGLLFYLPNPSEIVLMERKALAKQLEIEKKVLEKKKADISKNTGLSKKDKEELLKKIDDLIKELSKKNLTREEAVAKISQLKQELEKEKPAWGKSSDEMLQRLARRMSGMPGIKELSSALQNRDFKLAAKEAKKLSNLKNLSESEKKALSAELNRMSESASQTDPQLAKALSKLSHALGGRQSGERDLEQASNQLAQALEQAGQSASFEQMISSLSDQLSQSRLSMANAGQQSSQMASSSGRNSSSNQSGNNLGNQGRNNGQSGSNAGNNSGNGSGAGKGAIGARPNSNQGISSGSNDFGNIKLDRERRKGKYESIYAPELISANMRDEKLTGQKLQGEETVENISLPPSMKEALIPYTQVYYHYYDTAVEAINRGEIPPGMEEIIKNYFDSLRPNK